jgi:hypothetical protein
VESLLKLIPLKLYHNRFITNCKALRKNEVYVQGNALPKRCLDKKTAAGDSGGGMEKS